MYIQNKHRSSTTRGARVVTIVATDIQFELAKLFTDIIECCRPSLNSILVEDKSCKLVPQSVQRHLLPQLTSKHAPCMKDLAFWGSDSTVPVSVYDNIIMEGSCIRTCTRSKANFSFLIIHSMWGSAAERTSQKMNEPNQATSLDDKYRSSSKFV